MPESLSVLLNRREEIKRSIYSEGSDYDGFSALQKHVAAFGSIKEGAISFSPSAISAVLEKYAEQWPNLVGTFVNFFNATHMGQCPFGQSTFSTSGQTDFSSSLHLGTLRFYDKTGRFNEENWCEFVNNQEFISLSYLQSFLNQKNGAYGEEVDTGRNTHSFFSLKSVHHAAGREAWKELFKIMACDWQKNANNSNELEPVINSDLLKLFFEDTLACLEVAKQAELPVSQVVAESSVVLSTR